MDESALARVERQRTELEKNTAKLRQALRHWQTLEIDYEGLREEFLGIPDDSSPESCMQAAKDSNPDLVNEKELKELILDSNSHSRRPSQIVDLLSKRVDYVTRNIETIRKQLSDVEKKRNALLLAEEPEHREEAGLPLAEIIEELDDSGRVISSKVQTPGSDAPQLIDVLKKAGVQDLEESGGKITGASTPKKSVDSETESSDGEVEAPSQAQTQAQVAQVQKLNTSNNELPTNSNDTPAEAELRREMLEYSRGLDEVGAIVAELEMEEEASDVSYVDDDLDVDLGSEDEEEDSEAGSEEEDGRSKNPLILSRGYHKRMKELQERLGLKNVGPQSNAESPAGQEKQSPRPPAAEAARKAAIARQRKSEKSSLKDTSKKTSGTEDPIKEKPKKKRVAFSSELDVASESADATIPPHTKLSSNHKDKPRLRPINDSVIEREVDEDEEESTAPAAPAPKAAKQSRFKATRQTQPQTPMFAPPMTLPSENISDDKSAPQPPSKIMSTDLVERPAPRGSKAPDPEDFTDENHRREIAMDYQKHRIKRIHAQDGGFLGSGEEDEITPLEDDNGKRVSRFKAARVKK